jgi:hypothetical protein
VLQFHGSEAGLRFIEAWKRARIIVDMGHTSNGEDPEPKPATPTDPQPRPQRRLRRAAPSLRPVVGPARSRQP